MAETMEQETASELEPQAVSVSVDIYDQTYRLRGTDPVYIESLASLVDEKMRAVAAHGATVDSLRVAVLAALNIADELMRVRQQCESLSGDMRHNVEEAQHGMMLRAGSLAGLLDEVLEARHTH